MPKSQQKQEAKKTSGRITLKSLDTKIDTVDIKLSHKIDAVDKRLSHKIDAVDKRLSRKIDGVENRLNARIDHLAARVVTRYEFEEFKNWVQENMFTKKDFLNWLTRFEDILAEIRDMRQNRLLFESQFVDLDDQVALHERRIKVLEDKTGISSK